MTVFEKIMKAMTADPLFYRGLREDRSNLNLAVVITVIPCIFGAVHAYVTHALTPAVAVQFLVGTFGAWMLVSALVMSFGNRAAAGTGANPAVIDMVQSMTITGFASSPQLLLMWSNLFLNKKTFESAAQSGVPNMGAAVAVMVLTVLSIVWYFRVLKTAVKETFGLENRAARAVTWKAYLLLVLVLLLVGLVLPHPKV